MREVERVPGLYRRAKSQYLWLASRIRGRERTFGDIYRSNGWGASESVSGAGSTEDQTRVLRAALPGLLQEFDVRRLVDAPCGDLNWLRLMEPKPSEYVGCDIVPELVHALNQEPPFDNATFAVVDLVQGPVPAGDAVLCRDCLVHLSFVEARAALRNIRQSGSRYLITTTFTNTRVNHDVPTGSWRALNLQLAPFNFPEPLRLLNEQCTEGEGRFADKSLGVWAIADLPL